VPVIYKANLQSKRQMSVIVLMSMGGSWCTGTGYWWPDTGDWSLILSFPYNAPL